jgi:hypothetical protein
MGRNGAGGCVIASQDRHENRSRTVWITFHWRGITSSVSVTSSPSFDSLGGTATRTSRGRGDYDALARQMRGKRLAGGPLALDGWNLRGSRRLLGRQFVLARGGLGLFQPQFQLVEQALLVL